MRVLFSKSVAFYGVVLLSGLSANAADLDSIDDCSKPVSAVCTQAGSSVTCEANVKFVQQGPNTHLYGCEIRIEPQLSAVVELTMTLPEASPFRINNFKFNSVLGAQSQLAFQAQRPTSQTQPEYLPVRLEIVGKLLDSK